METTDLREREDAARHALAIQVITTFLCGMIVGAALMLHLAGWL